MGRRLLGSERGLALVLTLMVVALVSVLVLEYHFDSAVELDLAANYANDVQAYHLALSGVRFAQILLQADDTRHDGPRDLWFQVRYLPLLLGSDCITPQQLLDPAFLSGIQEAVAGGQDVSPLLEQRATEERLSTDCIKILITDEGGKLPLNALFPRGNGDDAQPDPTWVRIFEAFFESFQIDHEVIDALVDWLDTNETPYRTGGAENAYYERLPTPYRAKNSPMSAASELRLVKGFNDPETLAHLFPGVTPEATAALDLGSNQYLTPFPYKSDELTRARVNLNTASEPVLQALLTGAAQDGGRGTADAVEAIMKKRLAGEQFQNLNEALQNVSGNGRAALGNLVDVKSSFFRVEVEGRVGVVKKRIIAVVQRQAGQSSAPRAPAPRQPASPQQSAQPQQTKLVYFKVE